MERTSLSITAAKSCGNGVRPQAQASYQRRPKSMSPILTTVGETVSASPTQAVAARKAKELRTNPFYALARAGLWIGPAN
jgi:hypothetical protein